MLFVLRGQDRDEADKAAIPKGSEASAFKPAEATIAKDGKSITLTSAEVPAPKQVRFAWDDVANPNLVNSEGLPASPFLFN